jgi:hypothetical protein
MTAVPSSFVDFSERLTRALERFFSADIDQTHRLGRVVVVVILIRN